MNKKLIVTFLAVVGIIFLTVFIVLVMSASFHNNEVNLRTAINSKQLDNTSELDNTWKKISQVTQLADNKKDAFVELFVEYANARTPEGAGKLMSWIQEATPTADLSVYDNAQNIIVASRDSWTMRQKELVDMGREHDKLIQQFPGVLFSGILGRSHIEITVVTSTRTQNAFETGVDDDVSLR